MQPCIYIAIDKQDKCLFQNIKIAHSGKNEESYYNNMKEI